MRYKTIPAAALVLCGALAIAAGGCSDSGPKSKGRAVAMPEEPIPVGKTDATAKPDATAKETTAKEPIVPDSKLPIPKYLAGVPLISRDVLFGNPDKAAARLSPDAKYLSFLAPVNDVLNVWVGPADNPAAAKPVTKDDKRGIRQYMWAYTNQHIIYMQDKDGDENWHIYAVALDTLETQDLTPLKDVAAQIENVSYRSPHEILVGLNDRNPRFHDIYRINIETGKRELVQENTEGFSGFVSDEDYKIRFASRLVEDGSRELLEPDGKNGWKLFIKIPMADALTTSPAGFNKAGDVMYLLDSRDRDTAALTSLDLESGRQSVIAENAKADIGSVLSHPTENTIEAVAFTYTREEWQVLNPQYQADFDYLRKLDDGDITISSQSLDNQHWTVAYLKDDGPVRYYLYHRGQQRAAKFLFANRQDLQGLPLVKMHPLVIKARDGLELVCYLSLPKGTDADGDGVPDEALPLALDVHGGPWARDDWGFNAEHQWLANRGYAVLNVNFRGSTGFGKKFLNAGNREWAGKMHDDLLDAVQYCIEKKIADPKRICIRGGSYGGYATLVGLTATPDLFACGVDIVGPSNILTLLDSIPPYWEPEKVMFRDRVGDYTSEEGKKYLLDRSPLTHVAKINKPLLIGQGAHDPRVKQAEADQIVHAMQEKKLPVTYVLFPDEGHGFARPPNRMAFNAVEEAFLAPILGGRYEAIGGDFRDSTIQVPVGAADVPGLNAALGK